MCRMHRCTHPPRTGSVADLCAFIHKTFSVCMHDCVCMYVHAVFPLVAGDQRRRRRRRVKRIRWRAEREKGRICHPSGPLWANPVWHTAASGAANGAWAVVSKDRWRSGVQLRLGASLLGGCLDIKRWRVRMCPESEFLALEARLGTEAWLLSELPGAGRRTGAGQQG